ncbi:MULTISPECIES: TetR/AcrR family transcriptional regulator [unclassified Streptomyces]|uniref:TetR/AcrR family transcriptional regulator n=1 Tax=unclassified Streptomyces TaxID=2593676 RepID=UPI002DD893DB|nr:MULTISPECIES: TetR/AcrR family transcriptional regulator [unclassified Streptomyces]WSA91439.1 TetR/AcrR family transcriptional regulator [Streptomyces sp. NBC_01795]WSB75763.1 TetR/AcrR family transcriptional regulator [Streptomyces sp. NBC_01775]WSS15952.1 TetR/AcrR family transcriptional regulator [Streptomyces sp. NBC_01186]WSS44770.1 TetR/AcrR family transcriptional regulator [Streptomyces sp. NBC_01187]
MGRQQRPEQAASGQEQQAANDQAQSAGPKRSDALRNRERILEVALAELTRAPNVPLSSIARKAGVGQGTFYRNFPSREALILEIYSHEMTQVVQSATELLASRAPDAALRAWMDRLAEFALAKAGLADAIHKALSATGSEKPPPAELMAAAGLLLRAGEEAGTLRPGVTPDDFLLAITGLFTIEPDEHWKERSTRLLDLVMNGLRAGARNSPHAN